MGSGLEHLHQSTPSQHTTHINMADAEQQVVEEVAPEAAAEKPEEGTAVAAEPEASDPPAEAVAAVKISEEAVAAEGEAEAAPAAVVEGEEAAASPPAPAGEAAVEGGEPAPAAPADEAEEAPAAAEEPAAEAAE